MTIAAREIGLRQSDEHLLARYADLDALCTRAITACEAGDVAEACLVSYAVVTKLHVLDEKLGLVNLRDAGGRAQPPGLFDRDAAAPTSRRRRRAA